jgi:endonuclease/exonuclease/phosphatase (EEP) superfamily protein YafD
VASVHLDNLVGPRRVWVAGGEFARVRQLRGVLALLDGESPAILGGDLNTWFGFSERAVAEALRAFPQTVAADARPTFLGLLRLDHLFWRLPDGWAFRYRRLDHRFGSDHYPLAGTLRVAPPL